MRQKRTGEASEVATFAPTMSYHYNSTNAPLHRYPRKTMEFNVSPEIVKAALWTGTAVISLAYAFSVVSNYLTTAGL